MTIATQLQPYYAAAQHLLQLADLPQASIAEDQFLSAVSRFRSSVGPEILPAMPELRLAQLDAEIQRLSGFSVEGGLYVLVARSFVDRLRHLNFLPPASLKKPESPSRRYQRLIGIEPYDPGEAMMEGSSRVFDRKKTRRGIGAGGTAMAGALAVRASTRRPTVRRTVAEVEAAEVEDARTTAVPAAKAVKDPAAAEAQEADAVINPFTGDLMVAGRLWVQEKVKEEDGRQVDRTVRSPYTLERLIGRGGTSCVYLAREDGTNRELAVKIVNRARTPKEQEAIYQGFMKEQKFSGSSERERSVTVYGKGHTATGFPFIAMDYLSGGALFERAHEMHWGSAPFDLKEAVSLCAQAVAAVAEVHRDGIVHLDIKPENLFLTRDRKKAKLGDFGLAEEAETAGKAVTKEIFGTAGYIPPENIPGGAAVPVGAKQRDVWALGTTLYEVLTGIFPFEAPSFEALLTKMVMPLPPPGTIRPEIPPALDEVVMRALSVDPAARYKDAEELLFDLVSYAARDEEGKARVLLDDIEKIEGTMRGLDDVQAYRLKKRVAILRDAWRAHLENALREYGRLHDEYHAQPMKEKMAEINLALHRWADLSGDDEAVRHRSARIATLAPAGSAAVLEVARSVRASLFLDGRRPRGSKIGYNFTVWQNRAGVIGLERPLAEEELRKVEGVSKVRAYDFDRGPAYGLNVNVSEGGVPVFIPLPVRPGDYKIRIPIYQESDVPPGGVVIPGGPVAARQGPGSYSEKFDVWRFVDHDYAMLPLATNKDYFEYLAWVSLKHGRAAALARIPRNWKLDSSKNGFVYEDGSPILPNGPVTHISYGDALQYLDYLSAVLGKPVRLPTLNEWKRAMRGNDARLWSWGDAPPDVGLAVFRYPAPGGSGAVAAAAIDDPNILDISPFSVPRRAGEAPRVLTHLAGNVMKFLDPGTPLERRLIAQALNMSVNDLDTRYYLVAGASYDGPAPSNPDILRRKELTEIIPAGIFPVIQLRDADPTPSLESLMA